MKRYILSLDQGTTGSQTILIDADTFEFIDTIKKEYPQIYPKPGWVEHNLHDIWETIEFTAKTVLQKNNIDPKNILAIGITNQRETTCAFNLEGAPLANAIVWQDRRTSEYCTQNKAQEKMIREKTGLPLDPYFSGTKMKWLLENSNDVKNAAAKNNLKFGTIDTFLLYKLTAGAAHATDASNASRTLLMNLKTCQWDKELLSFFKIPENTLPQIQDTFSKFGTTKGLSFLPDGIPITCLFGDQQSALFGQGVYEAGGMKCTYGTGAFLLLNTGSECKLSDHGLLTTIAYKAEGKPVYAFEGACYIAGAAVQWVRDNLKFIKSSSDIENLAQKITDLSKVEHIMFMPFFSGLGSPYWKPEAKAAIVGMTRDTKDEHIAYAALEGIAFSIYDLVNAFEQDAKSKIKKLNVDGGACKNNLLMDIQATILNTKILRPKITETTGFGAGLGAAVGLGLLKLSDVSKMVKADKEFSPISENLSFYQAKTKKWNEMVKRLYL